MGSNNASAQGTRSEQFPTLQPLTCSGAAKRSCDELVAASRPTRLLVCLRRRDETSFPLMQRACSSNVRPSNRPVTRALGDSSPTQPDTYEKYRVQTPVDAPRGPRKWLK
jgi:hypothetical protein